MFLYRRIERWNRNWRGIGVRGVLFFILNWKVLLYVIWWGGKVNKEKYNWYKRGKIIEVLFLSE